MGPNGVGKSALRKVIIGDPNYKIESGSIYDNDVLLARYLMGGQPIPPLPVTRRKMPLWMMIRKRRFW